MNESADSAARLLRRYRTLCEALGIARANGATLPPSALDDLRQVEARLIELLERPAETDRDSLAPAPAKASPSVAVASPSLAPPPRERAAPAPPPAEKPSPSPSSVTRGAAPVEPSATPTAAESASQKDAAPESPSEREAPTGGELSATVYTDGSSEGNPGPGGYCAIVRITGRPDRELSGGTIHTTNNQMELTAAIAGLKEAVDSGAASITVVTDSEYVVKGATQWLRGWVRNGWKTASGQPVKNRDRWEEIARLTQGRTVRWHWVKGHAGHPENERADLIATTRAREAAQSRKS